MTIDTKAIEERVTAACADMSDYRKGARAMFDYLLSCACNHYSMRSGVKERMNREAEFLTETAIEALETVSPEDHVIWKDTTALLSALKEKDAEIARLREMVNRYGQAAIDIADMAQDEGDRAYFGSTNDLDRLRQIRDEYFEWRFLSAEELAKANAALTTQEPKS